jgi:signal transduction histidine kinase
MLFDFIDANRVELITRTRAKVAKRLAPRATERELESGVPLFLDQLAETLRVAPPEIPASMERAAALYGAALLGLGYTVAQVVHGYGDICLAITELAIETNATISTSEFHTLNLCLDSAIAGAVTEYALVREQSIAAATTERAGVLAHELRNRIASAQLGFNVIQSGRAPIGGSVASVVTRSLADMATLINRELIEVRVDSASATSRRVHLHQLIEEAEVDGMLEASERGVSLNVTATDPDVCIDVDPQILSGALANLIQNAFKFTPAGGLVTLRTAVVDRRVKIEIEDSCGGLPAGKAEELFEAFKQRGANRSGLGLGLFISRKGVEAIGGELRVRDMPGRGCVFTIELARTPAEV